MTIPKIILNEQHNLLPQQKEVLDKAYPKGYEFLKVPEDGWTIEKMDMVMKNLSGTIIFVSPIPYMIKSLSMDAAMNSVAYSVFQDYPHCPTGDTTVHTVRIMCNDQRIKKEINGKIISVLAPTGWFLA